MTNFQFLHNTYPELYQKMIKAEERVYTEPVSSAYYCRIVLEECIFRIYESEYLEFPYNTSLINLMQQEEFKALLPHTILDGVHIVRKTGNNSAHYGNRVLGRDALVSIKYIYTFLKWFANNYAETIPELPGAFNEDVIPKIGEEQRKLRTIQEENERAQSALEKQLEELLKEKEELLERARQSEAALDEFNANVKAEKKAIAQQRKERKQLIKGEFTEAQTRKNFIDVNLKEAGWVELRDGRELEYPVKGMPETNDNPKGNGKVDYVLWDDDGLPLAIVEAKRTSKDVETGKQQAFLYANCLEKMTGQRPVIFYSNGFETKIWDDTFYSTPRLVAGFYTKKELQLLIQRRTTRTDIRNATINKNVAGRPYQFEAIQRVAEAFTTDGTDGHLRGNKRNALLVMATGSGKTRTAAALVDVLSKHNWVKRVLFLADRNALVTQAKKSFGEHLKELSSTDLTQEKEADSTRLVFSTYPTMLNQIDKARSEEGRLYGVGHFDLIIVDEAHRSVYNKYKAIFDYFDSLIIGLTATPKDGIDHNTFELFECSNDDPTFAYDLEDAVAQGHLVPYQNYEVSTQFTRDGIKYKELTDKQKKQYEDTFGIEGDGFFPEEIPSSILNKYLFNSGTVNMVLDALMENGLKIEGGDKIGRTIIFAVNQKHAEFIVECFTKRYPQYPSGFIAMVHTKVSHAQSLIESFCDHYKEKLPQIAVSVDMMDTGIDAPRVLNLVFFKVVRSYAKFWQMIGRGTRLCPDVYGPESPKTNFLIFDVCKNFEFFDMNQKGKDVKQQKPVSQQIFETRLLLSRLLAETGEVENIELSLEFLDILHHSIQNLDRNRFQVQLELRYVEEFKNRERWNNLSADDVHHIETHLSNLPVVEETDETARRFDLLILKLQVASLLDHSKQETFAERVISIAEGLSKKYTIPSVMDKMELIESLRDPEFYKETTQKKLDQVRIEIRDLVQYLEKSSIQPMYSNIDDADLEVNIREGKPLPISNEIYKKRVERFIRENKNHLTISKLNTNQPITEDELEELERILFDGEERGTKDDFKNYSNESLTHFIRSILGLDTSAASEAFSTFIQNNNLSADQMTFISTIIDYLTKNGSIDPEMLFDSPFNDMHQDGIIGIFNDAQSAKIISIIEHVNENGEVG